MLATLLGLAALVAAWMLRNRLLRLEAEVAALRARIEPGGSGQAELPDPPAAAPEPAADTPAGAAGPRAAPATAASSAWDRAARRETASDPLAPPAPSSGSIPAGPGMAAALAGWMRENWIYPAAGAALVLAGLFLVQYAVEAGLLTPEARVVLALALGGGLVIAGEALRRRPAAGAILPAVLTGAGLVVAMAAVLAALHLYAMVGPGAALLALALLAFLAIALGWLHGPVLAALGLVAGSLAPFALGPGQGPPPALFGHFALLALAGLGIDAARRWGWVTWLSVLLPVAGAVALRLAGGDAAAFALALTVIAAAAMTLPFGRIAPVVEGARALSRGAPEPGVRASFVASAALAAGAAVLVPGWAGPVALTSLAALAAVWAWRAPALADQMLLPVLALPAWVAWQVYEFGPVLIAHLAWRGPEAGPPLQVTLLTGLAVLAGLAFLWRGEAEDPGRHAPWTLAGLALPGAVLAALETFWQPARALGVPLWSAHALALAAGATALALRYAARDAGQGPRLGASAAMAFALVALALMLALGQAALTLALAVLMVAAAALDRRFDIPALSVFQLVALTALAWRLGLDPGLGWHLTDAPMPAALLALAATVAGPLAALRLTRDLPAEPLRRHAALALETGLTGLAAVASGVAIARLVPDTLGTHAMLGLQATALLALAWAQGQRMALPEGRRLRLGLAWLLGLAAAAVLALGLTLASPVVGEWPLARPVAGWPLLNDLIPAYLLPGALLAWAGGRRWLQAAGWGLVAVWGGSAIRHLWQGPRLDLSRGIAEGELYAYTFALLAAGAVLMWRALATARTDLRRLALALVGLAAAKAFLIDAAGLGGLLRAGAFLALGLALAGLAWLNGWAAAREGTRTGPSGPEAGGSG